MANFFKGSPSSSAATGKAVSNSLPNLLTGLYGYTPGTKKTPASYGNQATQANSLGALSLDPSQIQAESKSLAGYSDPNFLQTAVGPIGQALTNQSNINLNQNLAGLRSRFAQSGQTSTGSSSPLLQAQAQTIGQTQQTLNDQIAQLYPQEQQIQQQGISMASALNMLPASLLAQLAPLLAKGTGATSSAFSQIEQPIGNLLTSIGNLAGGFTGGGSKGAAAAG